jgi:type IV pilus assembly protein PilW
MREPGDHRHKRVSQGFGLVELMIALALGTVIILGVTTLFSDSSRALNDITRAGRQLENSLYAMDLLAKELALVDYWGEASAPVDADDPAYGPLRGAEIDNLVIGPYPETPPLCVGTGATGFDPRVELAWAMEYPLLAGLGSEVNAAVSAGQCKGGGSTATATAAYVAVRRASTCATGIAGQPAANSCRPVDDFFYVQTNGCYDENAGLSGGEVKLYQAGAGTMSGMFDYTRYSCETSDFAPIYRYVSRIYYVNQSDQLVRLYFDDLEEGSLGYHQEILVEGVEDLQFEWFIDDTGNGEYDRVETTFDHTDAANVVGSKIWLMVRNTRERPGYVDETTYMMAGSEWTIPDGMAAYPRTLQSRMVTLPNRVGRRR